MSAAAAPFFLSTVIRQTGYDPAWTALTLLVCALGAYRAARVVTVDTIFEGWRARLEEWAFDGGFYRPVNPPRWGGERTIVFLTLARGKLADLFTCPLCLGVWLSAGLTVLAWRLGFLPGGRDFLLWIPAVAGLQCVVSQLDAHLMKGPDE